MRFEKGQGALNGKTWLWERQHQSAHPFALEKATPIHSFASFGKGKAHAQMHSLWERARKTFGKQPLGKGQESFWKTAFGKGLAKLLENSLWERA